MEGKHLKVSILTVILCGIFVCVYAARHAEPQKTEAAPVSLSATTSAVASKSAGKVLVVYFSVPETDGVDASSGASRLVRDGKVMGNTHYVASVISEATGGDLFEIKTAHAYPGSHKALIDAAKKEIDGKARPRLVTNIKNLSDYGVVFVGFPNWWYDMPMSLYSFFEAYDFAGKTLIPFCTHGGSRFSGAVETIRELEKKAIVLDGYAVARDRVAGSREGIMKWLERIGMTK